MDPSLTMDWMSLLRDRLLESFGDRIVFIGGDLGTYRGILDRMPHRELACGFVSGMDEIARWDPADLFQFRMDTVPILGDLDSILPPLDPDDSRRAAVAGACSIYHACVHNYVHERSPEILDALYKQGSYSGPSTTARPVCS